MLVTCYVRFTMYMPYMDIEIMLATIHCYNIYHGFVVIMKYIINFNYMFFIIQEAVYSTQVYSFKKLSKQHRGCCFM